MATPVKKIEFKVGDTVTDKKYNKEVVVTEIILKASLRIKDRWVK